MNINKNWNATWVDILRHHLLDNYNELVKPTESQINVSISLDIQHVDVNEKNGYFTVWGWKKLSWKDSKLTWKPMDYGNLTKFFIAEHEIWQPDIMLYNSIENSEIGNYGNHLLLVESNGHVLWVPQFKFISLCELNLRLWPFDKHECKLNFGSWVHSGNEVDLKLSNSGFNINKRIENNQWEIENVTVTLNSVKYECCPDSYPLVVYNIRIQRRSSMYKAVIVIPAIAISLMILSVFWLPPTSGEKIILNGINFIVLTMFLIYFAFKLPIFALSTPLVVIFYSVSLILVGFSTVISVLVIYFSKEKHEHRVPSFIGNLFKNKFGDLLCISSMNTRKDQTEMHEQLQDNNKTFENFLVSSPSIQFDWLLIAKAIDRIAFLSYLLILISLGLFCCVL